MIRRLAAWFRMTWPPEDERELQCEMLLALALATMSV
jgi:hypothetical protein